MSQSPELTEFYKAYLNWAEAMLSTDMKDFEGCLFDPICGLCWNVCYFYEDREKYHAVVSEMKQQFTDAGLDRIYPFDGGKRSNYTNCKAMHKNPARMNWVKEHANV